MTFGVFTADNSPYQVSNNGISATRVHKFSCTDSLATITAAGYLNLHLNAMQLAQINNTDIFEVSYILGVALLQPSINAINGIVTLSAAASEISAINGDSGTATGSVVSITAGNATQHCGSSVSFTASESSLLLNLGDSNSNIMLGPGTGNNIITGSNNLGIGINLFKSLSSGSNNFFIANVSGDITTGSGNTVFGYNTAGPLNNGSYNTAMGYQALGSLPSGSYNISIGYTSGTNYGGSQSSNICIGSAGNLGDNHVIRIGTQGTGNNQQSSCYIAGINNQNSSGFTSPLPVYIDSSTGQLGYGNAAALTINGDSGSISGTSLGIVTGHGSNDCGSSVLFSASGDDLFLNVSDSAFNTMIGSGCGAATMSEGAGNNTSVGVSSCSSLTTGSGNSVFGENALKMCTSGSTNVAVGNGALEFCNGNYNTAIGGAGTGSSLTTGSSNILIGYDAGNALNGNESTNVLIGSQGTSGITNSTQIGYVNGNIENGTQTSCYIDGISGITVTGSTVLCATNGQLGTISSSRLYKENIEDIGETSILQLRPVKYNYKSDQSKSLAYGLIAEEVMEIMPELVIYNSAGDPQSVKYHEMPALLLNEIIKLRKEIKHAA